MSTGPDDLPDLMDRAWPSGVPLEERAIAAGFTNERLLMARRRLAALLRYEDEGGDWARASKEAELDRASFFEMLRTWREHRSLASIMPRVRPHGSGARRNEELERLVATAIEENRGASRRRIAEVAAERIGQPFAISTIEAVVDRVQAQRERDDLGAEDGFGRLVLVDTCPAMMPIPGHEEPTVAWTGFVLDVATGLVISAAAAENPFAAFSMACLRAADRIDQVPDGGREKPTFEVHLRGDTKSLLSETMRLHDLAPDIDLRPSSGSRSESSRVSAILGRRFGPVTLKLRLTVPTGGEPGDADALSGAEMMDARLDAEADRRWRSWRSADGSCAADRSTLASMLRKLPPVYHSVRAHLD